VKIHVVQKGDTLFKIAKKYNVDFDELKQANAQLSNPDLIMPGMKVKIPTGGVPVKKNTGAGSAPPKGYVKEVQMKQSGQPTHLTLEEETDIPLAPQKMKQPAQKAQPAQKEMPITQPAQKEMPITQPAQKEVTKTYLAETKAPTPPVAAPISKATSPAQKDASKYFSVNILPQVPQAPKSPFNVTKQFNVADKANVVSPAADKSNAMVSPAADKSNAMVSPAADKSNVMVSPAADKSNAMVSPAADKSNAMVSPAADKSNVMVSPAADKSNAMVSPAGDNSFVSPVGFNDAFVPPMFPTNTFISPTMDTNQTPMFSPAADKSNPMMSPAMDANQASIVSPTMDVNQMPYVSPSMDANQMPYVSPSMDANQMPYVPPMMDMHQVPFVSPIGDYAPMYGGPAPYVPYVAPVYYMPPMPQPYCPPPIPYMPGPEYVQGAYMPVPHMPYEANNAPHVGYDSSSLGMPNNANAPHESSAMYMPKYDANTAMPSMDQSNMAPGYNPHVAGQSDDCGCYGQPAHPYMPQPYGGTHGYPVAPYGYQQMPYGYQAPYGYQYAPYPAPYASQPGAPYMYNRSEPNPAFGVPIIDDEDDDE
jgi:morphogenetic protein associated with SpoVID